MACKHGVPDQNVCNDCELGQCHNRKESGGFRTTTVGLIHRLPILSQTQERLTTKKQLGEVFNKIAAAFEDDLLSLNAEEIAAEWYWFWEEDQSAEWNTYKFSDILELHKKRWRRWEEYHNGSGCVVERVRDKYVMPRVREFLEELAAHQ